MYAIPWYAILLITVPQTIILIKLGYELFNIKIKFTTCLLLGLLIAPVAYFGRMMPVPFWVNTMLLFITLSILVSLIIKLELVYSMACTLMGVMITGAVENVVLPIILKAGNITINDLACNPWLNVASFIPIFTILLLLYMVIRHYQFVVFDLQNRRDSSVQG